MGIIVQYHVTILPALISTAVFNVTPVLLIAIGQDIYSSANLQNT